MIKTKKAIEALVPYNVLDTNYAIKLDANEMKNYLFEEGIQMNFDTGRYPQSKADSLRQAIASNYQLKPSQIIVGNGSTELLELVVKTYCETSDSILSFDPSFSMYEIYAKMYGVGFEKVSLDESTYELDFEALYEAYLIYKPKVIFVCTPNNPTGTIAKKEDVLDFIDKVDSLVIVDEAYMDFTDQSQSVLQDIITRNNALVARTFSKAYGLAAFRVGFMVGNESLMQQLGKVKLPYSLNQMSINVAVEALGQTDTVNAFLKGVIAERERLYLNMKEMGMDVVPSNTNFLLVKADFDLQKELMDCDILIRKLSDNTFRITVGSIKENNLLLLSLKEVYYAKSQS
jgi:histidinol-phosphate aminotransferase